MVIDWSDVEAQVAELSEGKDLLWKYGQRFIYDPETGKVKVV